MKSIFLFFVLVAILGFFVTNCERVQNPVDSNIQETQDHNETSFLAKGGFDQFGYNYNARIFVGAADGVDRNLDGTVWGDPTYANDHLVMKWSKGWDNARFHGAEWGPDAWENNEWNGKVSGGSGEVWHYKVIWVGPELENSEYWRPGGYPIWGQFEVIMDHGTFNNEHIWLTHAIPTGYGQ